MVSRVAVALPVLLLVAAGLAAALGVTTWLSTAIPLVLCLFIGVAWLAGSRTEGDSVFGFTSSSEQTGRYAESGGIARDEQDRAIREIQHQVEEVDED